MQPVRKLLLVTTLFIAAQAAHGAGQVTSPAQGCLAKMPAGKYKGLCLDLSEDRTVVRLSLAEKQKLAAELKAPQILRADYEVIENFSLHGKFWKAIIPVSRIQDMVYQQIDILPDFKIEQLKIKNLIDISHSQIRFELSPEGPPVQVIDEADPAHPKLINVPKGPTKDDLVFALWAVRAQGHQEIFNPFHGESGEYAATYALQGYDAATKWIIDGAYPTHQYLLARNQAQSQAAFTYSLNIAEQRGITYMYDTTINSCSNAVFDVLLMSFFNKANPGDTPFERTEKFNQSADPVGQLRLYQMIDQSKSLPSIQAEMLEAKKK